MMLLRMCAVRPTFSATVFVLLLLSLSSPSVAAEEADPGNVVASGDGILVTRDDVQAMRAYFETRTPFRTTEQEYARYTVQVRLFAEEAIRMKMHEGMEIDEKNLTVEDLLTLAQRYMKHIFDQYPVDERVLESYYRAFPEKFLKEDVPLSPAQARKETLSPDQLVPYEEAKDRIRKIILTGKQKQIVSETFQKLSEKYRLQFQSPPAD
jgi:hypothetical protein